MAYKNRETRNAYLRKRYAADPEWRQRVAARSRERRAADPEIRKRDAECKKAWRERNPEENRARKQRYYQQNREAVSDAQRKYREANRAKVAAYGRAKYVQDREARHAYRMYKDHGLRPEDWAAMWKAQDGRCYLCGESLADLERRFIHVDHDHAHCPKGKSCPVCQRGLACQHCNNSIGHVRDDVDRLRRMADALEAAQLAVAKRLAAADEQLTFDTDMLA